MNQKQEHRLTNANIDVKLILYIVLSIYDFQKTGPQTGRTMFTIYADAEKSQQKLADK